SVLDNYVFSFHVAKLMQALLQCLDAPCRVGSRSTYENPYARDLARLLRLNWNAQRNEQDAKRKDGNFSHHIFSLDPLVTRHLTLALPHLITLSARYSTDCGIVRPICLAVQRWRRFVLFTHLITLSARSSTRTGIVSPICLAALRLMTNSNFVACCIGSSPGLAPLRILST